MLEALLIRLSVIIVVAVASFVARGCLNAGSVFFPSFLEWLDLYTLFHVIFVVRTELFPILMRLLLDRTSVVKPLSGAIHHQTFSVLFNESAVSGRILNHVWLDGRQGLRELSETNLCIAI